MDTNTNDQLRSSTPLGLIAEITQLQSDRRRSPLEPRGRIVSTDNRMKLIEIRDKVKNKLMNEKGSNPNTFSKPVKQMGASFDSQDSDFEPLEIHESLDMQDEDQSIALSVPELLSVQETEEEKEIIESESDEIMSSDNSDFEYGDVPVLRTMSFLRFGASRAPVRMGNKRGSSAEYESMGSESELDHTNREGEERKQAANEKRVAMEDKVTIEAMEERVSIEEVTMEEKVTMEEVTMEEKVTMEERKLSDDDRVDITTLDPVSGGDSDDNTLSMDIPDNIMEDVPIEKNDDMNVSDSAAIYNTPSEPMCMVPVITDTTMKVDTVLQLEQHVTDDNTAITPSHYDTPLSPATNPLRRSGPISPISDQGTTIEDPQQTDTSYRFKRRNATRSGVGEREGQTPPDIERGSTSVSKDSAMLTKREKARLAVKRLRERKGMMSSSRSNKRDDDDGDILEFISPPSSPQDNNDHLI